MILVVVHDVCALRPHSSACSRLRGAEARSVALPASGVESARAIHSVFLNLFYSILRCAPKGWQDAAVFGTRAWQLLPGLAQHVQEHTSHRPPFSRTWIQ